MTVDEIRALVRLTTTVDSGEVTDAKLLTWINEGINDLSMRFDWPWLQANDSFLTVATQRAYSLSDLNTEVQELLFVIRSGDDNPLHPISYASAFARYGDDFPDGEPQFFYVHEEQINLVPVPTAVETIKVYYVQPPGELANATDEPPWLSTFHYVLVDFVESNVWEQQEDFDKAQYAMGRYLDRIDQMKRTYKSRINVGPWAIGSGRSPLTGRSDPFLNDWGQADVSP
jgi:hypothetical protein